MRIMSSRICSKCLRPAANTRLRMLPLLYLQLYPWACLQTTTLPVPASGRTSSFTVYQVWFSSFQQTYTIPTPCVYQSDFFPECIIFCPVYAHVCQVSLNGRDVCEARILIFGKINLIFCYQIWHSAALKSSFFHLRELPLTATLMKTLVMSVG